MGDEFLKLLLVGDDANVEAKVRPQLEKLAAGRELELKVVVTIQPDRKLDLFTGEVDDSIAEAGAEAEATAERGDAVDDVATTQVEVGDADPMLAIEDALATFEADRIVLVGADGDLLGEAKERFTIPVEELDEA